MRWAIPDRATLSGEDQQIYDRVAERQTSLWNAGGPGAYFGPLLNSPQLSGLMSDLGSFFKTGGKRGTLPDDAREFTDLVVSREFGSNAIFMSHLLDGVAVGVRPGAAKAVWERRDADLTDDERELADYIRSVIRGTLTDEACQAMLKRFGREGSIELTVFAAFLLMTARTMDAVGIPAPTDEQVESLLERVIEGTIELPDPAARTG